MNWPKCKTCAEPYEMRPESGTDTGYCDLCAQTMLADALRDTQRLEWLNSQRGCEHGTDLPLWHIVGSREDRRGNDEHLRESIDREIQAEWRAGNPPWPIPQNWKEGER